MKAGNKEELMQKLKIWHDENIDTYIKFKESVRKAYNGDMGFFNDNVNMLGFDVQEEIDQSESADIEFFMASQLLEKTKAHSQEYAEKIVQNAFNDDPHTLCMLYHDIRCAALFNDDFIKIHPRDLRSSLRVTRGPQHFL